MLLKRFARYRCLIFLLLTAFTLHLFSLNEKGVERYYSQGIYPYISLVMRSLLGWVPFSVGDVIYFLAGLSIFLGVLKLVKRIRTRQANRAFWKRLMVRTMEIGLIVYLLFNILWGLNYNRQGISAQWDLKVERYSKDDVLLLTTLLHQRLNSAAMQVNNEQRQALESNQTIHQLGIQSYKEISQTLPFLTYKRPSIKTSLYTYVGHFFGFTGYYNPISGEAQLKSTVPRFLQPFIMNHEIAHQVGYAKENEANFVAYITGRHSKQPAVQYATYFEAYLYAIRDLGRGDSAMVEPLRNSLHPQVKKDFVELIAYLDKNENVIEPYMNRFYDQFLKMNKQPKGTRTYNEVVAWLIAYMKKNGTAAI